MMNILHHERIFNLNKLPGKTDTEDIINEEWTICEKHAVGIIVVSTVFSLIIGLWSWALLYTGNTTNGSPIGIIFDTFIREWLNNL